MNINHINPHLRFADEFHLRPTKYFCRTLDCRIYYVEMGEGDIIIDGIEYAQSAGTVIIITPKNTYRFFSTSYQRIISINFDYTQNRSDITQPFAPVRAEDFSADCVSDPVEFEDHSFLNAPLVLNNMEYLKDKFDKILKEYTYKKQFYNEMASVHLKNILLEIVREMICKEKSSKNINEILKYVHNHYAEEINNVQLAQLIGYHPYHLNRLMKASTGTTLHQYVITYRIEMAKKHLRETDMPIFEISEACGYNNFSNFSSDFKKKTGLSPREYREKNQLLL